MTISMVPTTPSPSGQRRLSARGREQLPLHKRVKTALKAADDRIKSGFRVVRILVPEMLGQHPPRDSSSWRYIACPVWRKKKRLHQLFDLLAPAPFYATVSKKSLPETGL